MPDCRPIRSTLALALVLASFLWLVAPSPAAAQAEWRGTAWEVVCSVALQDMAMGGPDGREAYIEMARAQNPDWEQERLERVADERYNEEFRAETYRNCVEKDGVRRSIEEVLERSSRWLRDLGLGGPNLDPSAPDEFGDLRFLPSEAGPDCENFYCGFVSVPGDTAKLGWVTWGDHFLNDQFLFVAPWAMRATGPTRKANRGNAEDIYTPTHELFHTIQFGYPEIPRDHRWDWIIEGTAEHVQLVAAEKWGTVLEFSKWSRDYDVPLHRPENPGDPASSWKYGTWSFWDYMGERLGSPDRVAYLHDVFQADLSEDHGIAGVHEVLVDRGIDGGMHQIWPDFVRDRLDGPEWFREPNEASIELPAGETEVEKEEAGEVEAVAAAYVDLTAKVPPGVTAKLTVRLEPRDLRGGGGLEQLHLIVDDASRSGVPDQEAIEHEEFVLGGEETFAVRVAEVARQPEESQRASYRLVYRLETYEGCDYERLAEAMSPTAPPVLRDPELRASLDTGIPNIGDILEAASTGQAPLHGTDVGKLLRPGPAEIEIGGLVMDRGNGCVSHIGTNGLLEATMGLGGSTGGEGGTMAMMRSGPGESTLLFLYSPQIIGGQSHAGAFAVAPWSIQHGGQGGWQTNASARIPTILPGIHPDELEEGGSYAARLVVPSPGAKVALYTRWQGELVHQGGSTVFGGGTTWTVTTEALEGRVEIDRITGTVVKGELTLSGPAELVVEEPLDAQGRYERRTGPVTVTARFTAPAAVEVKRPHLVMYTETVDPEKEDTGGQDDER